MFFKTIGIHKQLSSFSVLLGSFLNLISGSHRFSSEISSIFHFNPGEALPGTGQASYIKNGALKAFFESKRES